MFGFKLNCDGSSVHRLGVGGRVIRDCFGNIIAGFSSNFGPSNEA